MHGRRFLASRTRFLRSRTNSVRHFLAEGHDPRNSGIDVGMLTLARCRRPPGAALRALPIRVSVLVPTPVRGLRGRTKCAVCGHSQRSRREFLEPSAPVDELASCATNPASAPGSETGEDEQRCGNCDLEIVTALHLATSSASRPGYEHGQRPARRQPCRGPRGDVDQGATTVRAGSISRHSARAALRQLSPGRPALEPHSASPGPEPGGCGSCRPDNTTEGAASVGQTRR